MAEKFRSEFALDKTLAGRMQKVYFWIRILGTGSVETAHCSTLFSLISGFLMIPKNVKMTITHSCATNYS